MMKEPEARATYAELLVGYLCIRLILLLDLSCVIRNINSWLKTGPGRLTWSVG